MSKRSRSRQNSDHRSSDGFLVRPSPNTQPRGEGLIRGSVLFTASSALDAGFEMILLAPAVRGIKTEGTTAAFDELEGRGGKVVGRKGGDWENDLKKVIQ